MRLGVLGGTFDPPHLGHLLLAETARVTLGLEQVLFLPVGSPTHKTEQAITPTWHRVAMTRLAIADNPFFAVSTLDAERPSPHYTVTLLPLLQQIYPQATLWLILGSDSLRDLPQWHQPKTLLSQCRLAVLERPGIAVDWASLESALPELRHHLDWLVGPGVMVSATMVRQFAAANHSLRYLIPEPVRTYVLEHHLYQPNDNQSST
ncbi:MAG: nicotinate-nucleotide adenylyltransferase [Candidatus Promineifilaceae bacterium]